MDLFHAKEKLWETAKAIGGDAAWVETWAEARCEDLEACRLDGLLATLRSHAASCDTARTCADYIERNRERMRYSAFRAEGLCVGSGDVEAGCKLAIATRLKRAGMHWTTDGADAIIALRCCILSGRYADYWEFRAVEACESSE